MTVIKKKKDNRQGKIAYFRVILQYNLANKSPMMIYRCDIGNLLKTRDNCFWPPSHRQLNNIR